MDNNNSRSAFFLFSFFILLLSNPLVFSATEILFSNPPTFDFYPPEINVLLGVNQSLETKIGVW